MFSTAMDGHTTPTRTENRDPSLPTTKSSLVDAFFKLCRGIPFAEVESKVVGLFEGLSEEEKKEMCEDAFVLWANTRDVRGGKGEREIGNWVFIVLCGMFPELGMQMCEFVPEFGSWKDVFLLMVNGEMTEEIRKVLLDRAVLQLKEDENGNSPSLCAKWAPREKKGTENKLVKWLAGALFPESAQPLANYRKLVVGINKRLGTVEILMAGNEWSRISPGSVPSQCLNLHRKAFLNTNPSKRAKTTASTNDRIQCASNFTQHALLAVSDPSKANVHGRVLHPHKMVKPYMHPAAQANVLLEAQWTDLRERLREEMPNLGKMVPICDVSGSMTGEPMEVAIALSLLVSELSLIPDRFITFAADPQWHKLEPNSSLREKVRSAMKAKWGMNTNFQKALELILDACVEGNVPPIEVGQLSLVVFSDMQFDAAVSGSSYGQTQPQGVWDTQYERLVKSFAKAGLASKWKEAYPVPQVVFWNLRGEIRDFPVHATTPGVACVSGFSPNLLKAFMQGATAPAGEAQMAPTPAEVLRAVLDDPRYQGVRDICAECGPR